MPSPTPSEFATFQVLSNPDFTDIHKRKEEDIYPDEVSEASSLTKYTETDKLPESEESSRKSSVVDDYEPVEESRDASPKQEVKTETPQVKEEPVDEEFERHKNITLQAEREFELQGLISEIRELEKVGAVTVPAGFYLNASLHEAQFLRDKGMDCLNSDQIIETAKTGIRIGSGMIESAVKNWGITSIDGYHSELTRDMNKFNFPLKRLYKKYWRNGSMSVEMEVAMLLLGPLVWTVVGNMMKKPTPAPKEEVTLRKPPMPPKTGFNIPPPWKDSPRPDADKTDKADKAATDKANEEIANKAKELEALVTSLKAREKELEKKEQELKQREVREAVRDVREVREERDEFPPRQVVIEEHTRKTPGGGKKGLVL